MKDWSEDMDLRLNAAFNRACSEGIVQPGNTVIIVTGSLPGAGSTNVMQIFKVPEQHKTLKVVSSSANLVYSSLDMEAIRQAIEEDKLPGNDRHGVYDLRVPL